MRQSGVVAAAGLYALDHHVERLAEDHENARLLAEGLAEIDGVTIDPSKVDTNIVVFEVADATKTGDELRSAGVQVTRLTSRAPGQDPADCEAELDGHFSGVEVTELVD